MGNQHTFEDESFERMKDEAFEAGVEFRGIWNLDQNKYRGEDTDANRALMEAFIHGVIGKTRPSGGK